MSGQERAIRHRDDPDRLLRMLRDGAESNEDAITYEEQEAQRDNALSAAVLLDRHLSSGGALPAAWRSPDDGPPRVGDKVVLNEPEATGYRSAVDEPHRTLWNRRRSEPSLVICVGAGLADLILIGEDSPLDSEWRHPITSLRVVERANYAPVSTLTT